MKARDFTKNVKTLTAKYFYSEKLFYVFCTIVERDLEAKCSCKFSDKNICAKSCRFLLPKFPKTHQKFQIFGLLRSGGCSGRDFADSFYFQKWDLSSSVFVENWKPTLRAENMEESFYFASEKQSFKNRFCSPAFSNFWIFSQKIHQVNFNCWEFWIIILARRIMRMKTDSHLFWRRRIKKCFLKFNLGHFSRIPVASTSHCKITVFFQVLKSYFRKRSIFANLLKIDNFNQPRSLMTMESQIRSLLALFFSPPNQIRQEFSPGHNIPYFVINNELAVLPLPRSRFSRDAHGPIPSLARLNGRVVPTVRLLRMKFKQKIIFIPHFEFDALQSSRNLRQGLV